MRRIGIILFMAAVGTLHGQVPVPFNTAEGRFIVQANKRFEKLEPRPPRAVFPMDGHLAYLDHDGDLKLFIASERRLIMLDTGRIGTVEHSNGSLAWIRGDSLMVLRDEKPRHVASGVAEFTLSDSLLVFHDNVAHQLGVLWRSTAYPLLSMQTAGEKPQWSQGTNTVTFFDQEEQRFKLFHRGEVRTLGDSTGTDIVQPGSDMVCYWDENVGEFRLWEPHGDAVLSDKRPRSVQAGYGLIAFVDAYGQLRCRDRNGLRTLTGSTPSGYWVRDSLLLYLDEGHLMLYDGRAPVTVERYVPEQWEVSGGQLVYLDINRALRSMEGGKRDRCGNESGIAHFEMYGDAILYTSPAGPVTVLRGNKAHMF